MSRLVVVSNRVANLRKKTQTGGLAVGLADAVKQRGGLWFGWNGEVGGSIDAEPDVEIVGKVSMVSLPMSEKEYADYYLGYANSVLWPLFHYRLDLVDYKDEFFAAYCRVNARFAAALSTYLRDSDLVWVHDYHLIPLGRELRRLECRQRLGFFLHIPFPPHDILSGASDHSWLVESLLSYDVVGFQTRGDLDNFLQYVRNHSDAEVTPDGIRYLGRTIHADAFPIGIDVEDFEALARKPAEDVLLDKSRRDSLGRKQIIGVDRLDYSKGLPDRMKAFDRLLQLHPELRAKVSYLQVAPPTREDVEAYSDIRTELEGLAGSINGQHADFNWTPISYIHRNVAREKLAVLFRTSQVGFVTPLRDGMNLVAKEFVAAQPAEDPGVLVLSQFAGAAEELEEALIVNPFDIDAVARSLLEALSMPLDERQGRHQALLERIRKQDSNAWLNSFLAALEKRRFGGPVPVPDARDDPHDLAC